MVTPFPGGSGPGAPHSDQGGWCGLEAPSLRLGARVGGSPPRPSPRAGPPCAGELVSLHPAPAPPFGAPRASPSSAAGSGGSRPGFPGAALRGGPGGASLLPERPPHTHPGWAWPPGKGRGSRRVSPGEGGGPDPRPGTPRRGLVPPGFRVRPAVRANASRAGAPHHPRGRRPPAAPAPRGSPPRPCTFTTASIFVALPRGSQTRICFVHKPRSCPPGGGGPRAAGRLRPPALTPRPSPQVLPQDRVAGRCWVQLPGTDMGSALGPRPPRSL